MTISQMIESVVNCAKNIMHKSDLILCHRATAKHAEERELKSMEYYQEIDPDFELSESKRRFLLDHGWRSYYEIDGDIRYSIWYHPHLGTDEIDYMENGVSLFQAFEIQRDSLKSFDLEKERFNIAKSREIPGGHDKIPSHEDSTVTHDKLSTHDDVTPVIDTVKIVHEYSDDDMQFEEDIRDMEKPKQGGESRTYW